MMNNRIAALAIGLFVWSLTADAIPVRIDAISQLPDVHSDFYLIYEDANENGLLEWSEITTFSGVFCINEPNGCGSDFYSSVENVPTIRTSGVKDPPIQTFALLSCAPYIEDCFENYWRFRSGVFGLQAGVAVWNYCIDGICHVADPVANVPEPGALSLLGLGIAGLGFARRRKAS